MSRIRRFRSLFHLACVLLAASTSRPASAQNSAPFPDDETDIHLGHNHVKWPAPESLMADLRSSDDATRLKALELLGLSQQQAQSEYSGQVFVDEVEEVAVRYAPLGTDDANQAIVGAVLGPVVFVAVATRTKADWTRIADFSCWCKYEKGDLLAGFIQVERTYVEPARVASELVVHSSGGGTGLYVQSETRFRIQNGDLKPVLSFTRVTQDCNVSLSGSDQCKVEHRWFYPQAWNGIEGAIVYEALFNVPLGNGMAQFFIPDIELRYAQSLTCKTYKWNEGEFRYQEFSAPDPCKTGRFEP